MSPATLAFITTFTPLVAFAISMLFFMTRPRLAQGLVLAGGLVSVAGALVLLVQGPADPARFVWMSSGGMQLGFGFIFDGLSLSFGAVVALITFCIQVYSIGYMSHDPAKTRFFAMLGLFGWAMLSFVYAIDLLQAFVFWELVGLASFFLIGFWYEKPSASAAAVKAFIMTRIGDVGLFIGILMILNMTALSDIPALLDPETGLVSFVSGGTLTVIMLLIFVGIVGKSAQFPLHTWLPDAMEGPTPVSALLHSATMVAAGVFLFARLHPLFLASETVVVTVLSVAVFTAVLSSTIAMVERDIKKVLAYSSISQLGFMLAALAAGSIFAGVLHLIVHAIFKALLFLCAGSYIHHLETNDMEEIGRRGGRRMRWTTASLIVGAGLLAGIPPLAGFFSKEEVLFAIAHDGLSIFWAGALFAAFLTAYYTSRMVFLIVFPRTIDSQEHGHGHGSDSPWTMRGPMMALLAASMVGGLIGPRLAVLLGVEVPEHSLPAMLPAIAIVAAGVAIAWFDYGRASAKRTGFIMAFGPAYTLFRNQWYIDAFYRATFIQVTSLLSRAFQFVEGLIDEGFDGLARHTGLGGGLVARLQSGWVQSYIAIVVVAMAFAGLFFGSR